MGFLDNSSFNGGNAFGIIPAYGSLNEDNPAGTVITCTTAGTYYQWVSSSAGLNNKGITATGGATGTLVIQPGQGGKYQVSFSVVGLVQATILYDWAIFKNGTRLITPAMNAQTQNGAANIITVTDIDVVSLTDGDAISLWVNAGTNGSTFTVRQITLMLHKLDN